MIYSMTGFGRAKLELDGREITVEMKSVNHRYLDLNFRMPRHISFVEDALRALIKKGISRGHADIFLYYKNTRRDARSVSIDSALLGQYLSSAGECAKEFGLMDDITLSSALRLPDVTDIVEAEEDKDAVLTLACGAAQLALNELMTMREKEGAQMYADLCCRFDTMERLVDEMIARAPYVVEDYRARLNERISKLLEGAEVDNERLAMEAAIFADRASIDEELTRLKSHITQAREALAVPEPAGRRLDFILQEMNREMNTIGSKANDAQITNTVITGKGELEKIREQIQNVE